jgi:hypothetical protein
LAGAKTAALRCDEDTDTRMQRKHTRGDDAMKILAYVCQILTNVCSERTHDAMMRRLDDWMILTHKCSERSTHDAANLNIHKLLNIRLT